MGGGQRDHHSEYGISDDPQFGYQRVEDNLFSLKCCCYCSCLVSMGTTYEIEILHNSINLEYLGF